MKIKNITNNYLNVIADNIKRQTPGLGFALILFEFNESDIARYVSNAQRKDMLKALKEMIKKLELEEKK